MDWDELYEEWFEGGDHDILDFGGRSLAFIQWLFEEGHRPSPPELRAIVASIDLIDGEELDRKVAELAEEDWDIEAILVG